MTTEHDRYGKYSGPDFSAEEPDTEVEDLRNRIAELEEDRDHQLKARKDLEAVIRDRNKSIAKAAELPIKWMQNATDDYDPDMYKRGRSNQLYQCAEELESALSGKAVSDE